MYENLRVLGEISRKFRIKLKTSIKNVFREIIVDPSKRVEKLWVCIVFQKRNNFKNI